MSRIFRRPMFRGGSTNMNGIMSGIEDRKKYDVGGSARERLAKVAAEYPSQAIDPLSQFLIQGGLNLVSQPSTGGVFSDIASAAKEPTGQLFESLAQRGQFDKKLAMEGEILDIETENKRKLAQEKSQSELDQIAAKAKYKVGENFRTDQVRPAFENVVASLTETYQNSKNPAVKIAPDQTAFNVTKFRREADPKIVAKYKGFKPYTYDSKGTILALPVDNYKPGDIVYDPVSSEFLVFDNAGGTYRLNPLTYEIEE